MYSVELRLLSSSFLPGGVKTLAYNITTPRCYKYTVLGRQDMFFSPHAVNAKTYLLCRLVYKLFSVFATQTACKLLGTATFVFLWPLTHQPRPKLAATQWHPPIDMLLM